MQDHIDLVNLDKPSQTNSPKRRASLFSYNANNTDINGTKERGNEFLHTFENVQAHRESRSPGRGEYFDPTFRQKKIELKSVHKQKS